MKDRVQITDAFLEIEINNDDCWNLDLSPIQLKAIFLALGISFKGNNSYKCLSDESIEKYFIPALEKEHKKSNSTLAQFID